MSQAKKLPAKQNRGLNSRTGGQNLMVFITVGCLILYYTIFLVFPIVYSFIGSFFDWMPMTGQFDYCGLENYKAIFTDELTWISLRNTLAFTAVTVICRTGLGLIFAVLINEMNKSKTLFRTAYFMPVVTSTVAVSIIWKWLYEPANGPFSYYLLQVGFPQLYFLKDPNMALWCVALMTIWKDMGYAMVIFMAGLTGIPSSLYESASIDGSTRWTSFRYITLPLLKPTTLFVMVTSLISYCQTFTQIKLMTEGGPGTATYTLVYQLYQEGFQNYRFGRASAISFFLFAIILVLSILQMKMNKTDWGY